MLPTLAHGKICYIEIPALDVERSADFYAKVFGWRIRLGGAHWAEFDDGAGEVRGCFVKARLAHETPGLLLHIMVENAEATIDAVPAEGVGHCYARAHPEVIQRKICNRRTPNPPRFARDLPRKRGRRATLVARVLGGAPGERL